MTDLLSNREDTLISPAVPRVLFCTGYFFFSYSLTKKTPKKTFEVISLPRKLGQAHPHTPLIFAHTTTLRLLSSRQWPPDGSLSLLQWQQLCPPLRPYSRHLPRVTPGGFGSVRHSQLNDTEYGRAHTRPVKLEAGNELSPRSFYFNTQFIQSFS